MEIYGWVLIAFGTMPILAAIVDKSRVELIIGGMIICAGVIFLILGRYKKRG